MENARRKEYARGKGQGGQSELHHPVQQKGAAPAAGGRQMAAGMGPAGELREGAAGGGAQRVYATEAHREDWAQRMYSAISTYIQGKKLPLRAMKRGRYVFIEMDPAKEKKLREDRR